MRKVHLATPDHMRRPRTGAERYRNARDFGRADRLTPVLAPATFALRLDELELS
jgi:hypothetical protein